MGNYERFLNRDLLKTNYMTTGSIYQAVIQKERNLEYGGKCVEVVPHIPLEVLGKIDRAVRANKADIVIVEIGGTIGEYQNILFLETYRILKLKRPEDAAFVLVSHLPIQNGEMKTKPTQYAVRSLNSAGIQPNIVIARSAFPIDRKRKEKIAFNCNIDPEDVISAPDIKSIYEVPMDFEKDGLGNRILEKLHLRSRERDLRGWRAFVRKIRSAKREVKIGIVGKYFKTGSFVLTDSYISVIESVKHAAYTLGVEPIITWLSSEEYEKRPAKLKELGGFHGIIVPGGFGSRGVEGKIKAIEYCRERKIPYFGLCYGMQLAIVEFARHVCGMTRAHTTEIDKKTHYPVIDILPEQKERLAKKQYGASMRLGSYPAVLGDNTIARKAYRRRFIVERHRHRYEVNHQFMSRLEKKGLVFSGASPDRRLMEIAELPKSKHPFFLGTQFHPEFQSRPLAPHPLFLEFVRAASKRRS